MTTGAAPRLGAKEVAARVANLHEWAHGPETPDEEWAGVYALVFRAIEAEAIAAERERIRAAVELLPRLLPEAWITREHGFLVPHSAVLAIIEGRKP